MNVSHEEGKIQNMTTIICSTGRFKTYILGQYMLMYSPYINHIVNLLLH